MAAEIAAVEHTRPDGLIESNLVFKGYQDGDIRAYRVRADRAEPQPAIIMIPEFRGIQPEIKEIAARLAEKGYVVLLVEPFSRDQQPIDIDDSNALLIRMAQLSDTMVVEDLKCAANHLRGQAFVNGDRIGVTGFCMGGLYARLLGCSDDSITCAVEFYGSVKYDATSEAKPVSPIDAAKDLHCPYLGFFGAKDDFIPVDQVRELEQLFSAENKDAVVEIYDKAGHAFMNHARELYVEDVAQDAWTKTLAFFTQHLRA